MITSNGSNLDWTLSAHRLLCISAILLTGATWACRWPILPSGIVSRVEREAAMERRTEQNEYGDYEERNLDARADRDRQS